MDNVKKCLEECIGKEGESLIEEFFRCHTETHPVESAETEAALDAIEKKLLETEGDPKKVDELMDMISETCVAFERAGFKEGMRVGMRLLMELEG